MSGDDYYVLHTRRAVEGLLMLFGILFYVLPFSMFFFFLGLVLIVVVVAWMDLGLG